MKCTTALHIFNGVGIINDTEERLRISRFTQLQTQTWLGKHPITTPMFEEAMKLSNIKSDANPKKCFQEVKQTYIVFILLNL